MKNFFYIYLILFLSLSCNDKIKSIDSDTIAIEKSIIKNVAFDDEIYNDGGIIIYGDTTIDINKISYISRKFEPYISFSDFKVDIEKGKKEALDLNSNELGQEYRTMIRNDYKDDKTLFAGHYTFSVWGCGSPCQMSLLIDNKTGKIYDSPTASKGYNYKANSRMLIVNPPDSLGYYNNCVYCIPEIYLLNEKTKKFEQRKSTIE
jgi:hypothetical protein